MSPLELVRDDGPRPPVEPPRARRVAVLGGTRVPFAPADGPYATVSGRELLTAAVNGLAARYGLDVPGVVGELVTGGGGGGLARETVLGSKLDARTPSYDIRQACGTGLHAVIAAANKIALGQTDSAVAGGADSASDVPVAVDDRLRRILLEARRAGSTLGRLRILARIRPAHMVPDLPDDADPRTGRPAAEHAEATALAWGIDRAAQDELAATGHQRLAAAYERGFYDDLVIPFRDLRRDQHLRPDSAPVADGAAVVLLASEEWAETRGLEPLAHLTAYESAAVDPVRGADGPLTAPAHAVPRMLARTGLRIEDFDLVEIHEAYASQALATLAAWEKQGLAPVDHKRLNVAGSSLATGHPAAATGARIVATLAKLLAERGRPGRGLISIGGADGQAVSAVLEHF